MRRVRQLWRLSVSVVMIGALAFGITACAHHASGGLGIKEFRLPEPGRPQGITVAADGSVWFTDAEESTDNKGTHHRVGRATEDGKITWYELGGPAYPEEIVAGPDGNLWITAVNASGRYPDKYHGERDYIIKLSLQGTVLARYPIPAKQPFPMSIAVGADGALWFTEEKQIGRVTQDGKFQEFALTPNSAPGDIVRGPDGKMWFTDPGTNAIGRIGAGGKVTEFTLPGKDSDPAGITSGSDGNVWFTEPGTLKIQWLSKPNPTFTAFDSYTSGPSTAKIAKISTTGTITEFPIASADSDPISIIDDGHRLWFTEGGRGGEAVIGIMDHAGHYRRVKLADRWSEPSGLVRAPSGAIWCTLRQGAEVGLTRFGALLRIAPAHE